MGRIKSRRGATAATSAATAAKRPRASRARAAAAVPVHLAKPPRTPSAANSRTPVAGREPVMAQAMQPRAQLDLPPFALPSSQHTPAPAPLAEPSLWQELSQPLMRRIARRQRALSNRAARQLALMRLAARRTQRLGARAWEQRLEQLQAVQRELRRRRRDLVLSALHRLRWIKADVAGFIATPRREAQPRPLRAAQAALRGTIDSTLAGAGRAVARIQLTAARQFTPPSRDTLAGALAALAVAVVSIAWLAVYLTLAPTREARKLAAPAAPAKEFTERAATPAPPSIALPAADAPAAPAAEVRQDAAPAPAPAAPPEAAPVPSRRKAAPPVRRHRARATRANAGRQPATAGRQFAPLN